MISRIESLRFPLICMVVFIHAESALISRFPVARVVQQCCSIEFSESAVAALLVIAGYLIYRNGGPTWPVYRRKMRNRFWSLVVPYFAWNAIVLTMQVAGQLVEVTRPYFTGNTIDVAHVRLWDFADAFIGFHGAPIIGPFWFLKVLIILSFASPALWRLCEVSRGLVLPALFLWYLTVPPTHFLISYPVKSTFYYSLGLWLAQKRIDFDGRSSKPVECSILVAYPIIVAANIALWLKGSDILILRNLYTFYSVIFVWVLWGRLPEAAAGLFISLAPVAFFLYAAHGIVIQVVRKGLGWLYMPSSEIAAISMYMLPPVLTIGVLILVYRAMKQISPKALSVLCGGRVR